MPHIPGIEDIRQAVAEALDERFDELRPLLSQQPPAPLAVAGHVRGIDPHRLYTATQVAERLGYESAETVQRMDAELLPRAPWRGPGVRYWGADVLRVMGVPDNEIAAAGGATIHRMPGVPSPTPQPRSAPHKREGRRIKNTRLPEL